MKVEELSALIRRYEAYDGVEIQDIEAAITTALTAAKEVTAQGVAPVSMQWLAEMIMSDCGCSTNNQRLLDRIIDRIDQYERANTAQQPAPAQRLSDDWIYTMYNEPRSDAEMLEFARAIETAFAEKNGITLEQKQ